MAGYLGKKQQATVLDTEKYFAELRARDNTWTGDNAFTGLRTVPTTVTGNYTIGNEYHVIVNTDASSSPIITVPSGFPVGRPIKITRLGAYDTTNTNSVRILSSDLEYFTAGQLTEINLYGNGSTWELMVYPSGRIDIIGGYDRGSNSNGDWVRDYNGKVSFIGVDIGSLAVETSAGALYKSSGGLQDFPILPMYSAFVLPRVDSNGRWGIVDEIFSTLYRVYVISVGQSATAVNYSVSGSARWYQEV